MRLFFAIDLPASWKESLTTAIFNLQGALGNTDANTRLKWIEPQQFHITLQFLTAVDASQVAKLISAASEEMRNHQAFELALGGLEWFPSVKDQKILSLQIATPAPVEKLANSLAKSILCSHLNLEGRAFRPHLSLARLRSSSPLDLSVAQLPWESPSPALVSEVVLLQSEPSKGGSLYTPLACLGLQKPKIKAPAF